VSGKFIGYFRLLEACERPGCPVCSCLVEDGRRQLDALTYEMITDVDTRRRLRAAWGLCHGHTWTLTTLGTAATGTAIVYEDLLRVAAQHVGGLHDRRPARVGRFLRWLNPFKRGRPPAAPPRLVDRYRARARCPICLAGQDAELRYLDAILDFIDDPEFAAAYARSSGLCVPHAVRMVDRRPGTAGLPRLLDATIGKWTVLRGHLAEFVRKHEYRSTEPISDSERAAWALALEMVAGARGAFGHDRDDGGHPVSR
jgi:Family of unknown function (DUF6062)